jgi:hypothetical protein
MCSWAAARAATCSNFLDAGADGQGSRNTGVLHARQPVLWVRSKFGEGQVAMRIYIHGGKQRWTEADGAPGKASDSRVCVGSIELDRLLNRLHRQSSDSVTASTNDRVPALRGDADRP